MQRHDQNIEFHLHIAFIMERVVSLVIVNRQNGKVYILHPFLGGGLCVKVGQLVITVCAHW